MKGKYRRDHPKVMVRKVITVIGPSPGQYTDSRHNMDKAEALIDKLIEKIDWNDVIRHLDEQLPIGWYVEVTELEIESEKVNA